MSAAETYAALAAIKAGIEAAMKEAGNDALSFGTQNGVKSFMTPFGAVTLVTKDPAIAFDDAALLAWVQENHPTEVETITRVRPSFEKVLRDRLVIVKGEDVLDPATGELLEFATVVQPGDPHISFPSSKEQKAAKAEAVEWVRGRTDELTGALKELTS